MPGLNDYRCPVCGRLLLRPTLRDGVIEARCPRCHMDVTLSVDAQDLSQCTILVTAISSGTVRAGRTTGR